MSTRGGTILILALTALILTGCTKNEPSNLQPLYLEFEPAMRAYSHPDYDISRYRTFAFLPASSFLPSAKLWGIEERQVIFTLRNTLERNGFRMVDPSESPDFFVTIDGSAPYEEVYVPPSTVTVPEWVPSRRITTNANTYGSMNFGSTWGSWSGTSTVSTYIPGYFQSRTYTRPGYNVGAYYPSVTIVFYDGRTYENIWTGVGVGTSYNSDFRVSSQLLISNLIFTHMPHSIHWRENGPQIKGRIGIQHAIFSVDGNNYFPAITDISPDGPASRADLKLEDFILAINGRSTLNRSFYEVLEMITGPVGSTVTLTIWRQGKQFDVTLTRE